MPTQRKVESVADLTDKLNRAQMALVADYRGLTVAEITDLRNRLRKSGAELIIAKNTLVLRAAQATGQEALLEEFLSGPTAVAFGYDNITDTAKTINDFNKGPKQLVIRGGLLGNSQLAASALDQVSKLPTRQQVIAEILGGVAAPLAGVVGVLNGTIANVLYTVQARIDQLGGDTEVAA